MGAGANARLHTTPPRCPRAPAFFYAKRAFCIITAAKRAVPHWRLMRSGLRDGGSFRLAKLLSFFPHFNTPPKKSQPPER